ncbi:phosphatase PAP2 family protein [Alloiococcus sp. CFN-8]|uniref:phosphatase PAP2 family protein n=1 Tax=Alloiococcus sp. CFN-8 TaxID=3416081 RepID=UPI003CFBC253
MKKIKELKSYKREGFYLMIYLILTASYKLFNTPREMVYDLTIGIDRLIPFTKEFIVFYYIWYLFLAVTIIGLFLKDRESYFRYLKGLSLGLIGAYLTYTFFQSTVPRPEVIGNDIFAIMVRQIYAIDNPYNCFPSIHVFATVYGCLVISKSYFNSNKLFKITMYITGILIILSTLFVKQHVILDAVGGSALAYLAYVLYYKREGERVRIWIKKLFSSLTMKKKLEI